MKRYFSIVVIAIFILQSFVSGIDLCCDLEKTVDFEEHFQDHKQTDDDGFISFVMEEYFSTTDDGHEHHNGDSHEDAPCQNCSQCTHSYTAPFNFPVLDPLEFPDNFSKSASAYVFSIRTNTLKAPFQPPKA